MILIVPVIFGVHREIPGIRMFQAALGGVQQSVMAPRIIVSDAVA